MNLKFELLAFAICWSWPSDGELVHGERRMMRACERAQGNGRRIRWAELALQQREGL